MHILSVASISKDYGPRPVLENVSLGIDSDDRVGLVGVNGSGKTTFLRLVAGDEA
jgi:ATP-binding cassette subfamily F protein uup